MSDTKKITGWTYQANTGQYYFYPEPDKASDGHLPAVLVVGTTEVLTKAEHEHKVAKLCIENSRLAGELMGTLEAIIATTTYPDVKARAEKRLSELRAEYDHNQPT